MLTRELKKEAVKTKDDKGGKRTSTCDNRAETQKANWGINKAENGKKKKGEGRRKAERGKNLKEGRVLIRRADEAVKWCER